MHTYEFNGNVVEQLNYKYAHDYFRSHSVTLKYKYDSRTKDYLYRYTMWPKNGYLINGYLPFEPNELSWTYYDELLFSNIQSGAYRLPNGNTFISTFKSISPSTGSPIGSSNIISPH